MRYSRFGGFDIRRPESLDVLKRWAAGSNLHELATQPEGPLPEEDGAVPGVFQKGTSFYQEGRVEEAVATWREALALDPDNYIIRKQIWAVENPERFYDGAVDYDWQREQMG